MPGASIRHIQGFPEFPAETPNDHPISYAAFSYSAVLSL